MRRTRFAASILGACALVSVLAGLLAAFALADSGPPATTTGTDTSTTATDTTPTDTTPTDTTTTPSGVLPPGVRIGGVAVGGMALADATSAVTAAFQRPVLLRYRSTTISISPDLLGARAKVDRAIATAQTADPDGVVPLSVVVSQRAISAFLQKVADRFARDPVDSRLLLRRLAPVITPAHPGVQLDVKRATLAVAAQLRGNTRATIAIRSILTPAKVTPRSFSSIIVIRRGSNTLTLYRQMHEVRQFGVATGQSVYPTPLGRFQIVVKWENPWWYPPASPWAQGLKPVPPGPGNPLGTRWMGLSAPGVGIHGTPDSASIGYSASHGCIRMLIPQAEWLFNHVEIGTPVFIVSA
ncbi:MAG TPA: L,D-transpeptidase family protein [Gaiellaceae bacterium]